MIRIVQTGHPDKDSNRIIDKFYSVYANHSVYYFKSERRMNAWLGELNDHLNSNLYDLNMIVTDIYMEYRYYFFHLKSSDRRKIDSQFISLNKAFDLLLTRTDSPNYNHFAYQHTKTIIASLQSILSQLENHPMNKFATVQRNRIKSRTQRLNECKNRLTVFPDGYDRVHHYDRETFD